MAKRIRAEDYTRSAWSGEEYARPQTLDELTAEGKAVTARLKARCDAGYDQVMAQLRASVKEK